MGAGNVGRAVVDALHDEHDLTVIDTNGERLSALADRYDEARSLLAAIAAASGVDATWQEYSALAAGAAGDHAAANQHWHALQTIAAIQPVSAWTLARAAAAAGQHEAALPQIEAAAAARSSSVPFLAVSPAFDSLHDDARFHALSARLGLPRRK